MEIAQKPSTDGRTEPPTNEADVFARNFFWVCLIAWGISFFLPAARYEDWGQTKTMLGWEAAFTSLMLLIVPVKGLLLGLLIPHVWSVFANVFMIWAPFKIRRVSPTNSRKFSISFTASSLLAVGLLFIPESMDLARIRAFEVGYVLWTLSLIGASASFCWLIWGERRAVVPHTLLAATLFCGLFVWSPFLAGKWHRAQQQRDQWAWLTKANQQYSAEHAADISAIAQRGLLAFNTPLNSTQEDDLESYILSAQQFTPEDLIAASERYQNPTIMNALAQKPNCPPEALAILFQHATEKEKEADPIQKARAQRVYFQLRRARIPARVCFSKCCALGLPMHTSPCSVAASCRRKRRPIIWKRRAHLPMTWKCWQSPKMPTPPSRFSNVWQKNRFLRPEWLRIHTRQSASLKK